MNYNVGVANHLTENMNSTIPILKCMHFNIILKTRSTQHNLTYYRNLLHLVNEVTTIIPGKSI